MLIALVGVAVVPACRKRHRQSAEDLLPGAPAEAPAAAAPAPPSASDNVAPLYYPPPAPAPAKVTPPDMAGPRLGYASRPLPDGGTVNGHPDGPQAEALNKVLQESLPRFEACLNASTEIAAGQRLQVNVKYQIGNDGKPINVAVAGPVSAKVQACITSEVSATTYPKFGGPPIDHAFPLDYQRQLNVGP